MDNPFDEINHRLSRLSKIENSICQIENKISSKKGKSDTLFNVNQAAEFLQESKATLYGRTSRREIPFYKRGKKIYFKNKELLQ